MPIPKDLLKAAFTALPEATLRWAAPHCLGDDLSMIERLDRDHDRMRREALGDELYKKFADLPGRPKSKPSKWDAIPVAELVELLAADDGTNLQSISNHMSIVDLQAVAKVFGIEASGIEVGYAVWKFVLDYDKRQREMAFHQTSGVAKMTKTELRAEVEALAKPCVHLTRNSEDGPYGEEVQLPFAGIWGGPGLVPAPAATRSRPDGCPADRELYKHWITLDCARLPAEFAPLHLTGAASIYTDEWCGSEAYESGKSQGCVALAPDFKFPEKLPPSAGTPLYAKPGISYPSQFQIIDFATPAIRDWLTKMGYTFEKNDYGSLPAAELQDLYKEIIDDFDPVRQSDSGIVAVVGGWTIDIEFTYAKLLGDRVYQLVFTLEDSEPWVQAYIGKKSGKYFVRSLIT